MRSRFLLSLLFIGFITSCKTNFLDIKYSVDFDENNKLIGLLNIHNLSKDTILIPRRQNLMPKDKDPGVNYSEIYMRNGRSLDTIKSGNFTWSPFFDYFSTEEELTLKLLPSSSYSYSYDIGSRYFPYLYKGKYIMKVCFEPKYNVEKDTCVFAKFKLTEDFYTITKPLKDDE